MVPHYHLSWVAQRLCSLPNTAKVDTDEREKKEEGGEGKEKKEEQKVGDLSAVS